MRKGEYSDLVDDYPDYLTTVFRMQPSAVQPTFIQAPIAATMNLSADWERQFLAAQHPSASVEQQQLYHTLLKQQEQYQHQQQMILERLQVLTS